MSLEVRLTEPQDLASYRLTEPIMKRKPIFNIPAIKNPIVRRACILPMFIVLIVAAIVIGFYYALKGLGAAILDLIEAGIYSCIGLWAMIRDIVITAWKGQ